MVAERGKAEALMRQMLKIKKRLAKLAAIKATKRKIRKI